MAKPKPDILWGALEQGSADWLAASTLFGWSVLLILIRLVFRFDFIGPRLILLLGGLGLVLSGVQGIRWASGAMAANGMKPIPVELQLDNSGAPGRYNLSAKVMSSARRQGPKAPDPTRGGYVAWWVFVRMPMVVGALCLTALWTILSRIGIGGGSQMKSGPQPGEHDTEGEFDVPFR